MALPPLTPTSRRRAIVASSLGTVFEWYDFFLYGALAVLLGKLFFPSGNETAAFLSSLATFGAGFVVRPFGALVFGRLGDLVGRKYTVLLTIVIMGVSTLLVGLLPTYSQIGMAAPILLVTLRLAQGLSLGGEYGGAAIYVAEHAPAHRRGLDTSWIQTTATLGFLLSLVVILSTRLLVGEAAFEVWGWRIPFILSTVLVVISVYIRLKLRESPAFAELKAKKRTSAMPLRDAFGNPRNRRLLLLSLLGSIAGQGVVWYTSQFYALFFLQNTLKVDAVTSYLLIATALVIGTPLFVLVGALSDRIGRQRLMLAGMGLGAMSFIPLFQALTHYTNPNYPAPYNPALLNAPMVVVILSILMLYAALVYGPIAAYLVELFPVQIRYTSISLPYHLGNGWFGGLLPLIAASLVVITGNIYAGLYYPIAVCVMSMVVSLLFLRRKEDRSMAGGADL